MNHILNRLTVILALVAFAIVATVGFMTGVRPMVSLFRATAALVFFGVLGRVGFKIVLKGILEELAKHKEEQEQKEEAAREKMTAEASEETNQTADETTTATE